MTQEQADELSAAIRAALDIAHEEGIKGKLTDVGEAAENKVWKILNGLIDT